MHFDRDVRAALSLAVCFLLLFTAYNGTQTIESSVNATLGYWSVATIYFSLCFGAFVAAPFVQRFGIHASLTLSSLSYTAFVFANIFPSYATMMPTAFVMGFFAAILWTSQGTVITNSAVSYAAKKDKERTAYVGLFNGVFYFIFQQSNIYGNLLSSLLFVPARDGSPPDTARLFTVFSIIAAVGTVLFFLLFYGFDGYEDDGPDHDGNANNNNNNNAGQRKKHAVSFTATFKMLRERRLLLLLPFFWLMGTLGAFVFGDFTSSVVAVAMGDKAIGYVMTVNGVANVLGSLFFGRLSDAIGSAPVVSFAFVVTIVQLISFITIPATSFPHPIIFLHAFFLGLCESAFTTQMASAIGAAFMKKKIEAAFANSMFWRCICTSSYLFLAPSLSLHTKAAILICLCAVAFVTTVILLRDLRAFTASQRQLHLQQQLSRQQSVEMMEVPLPTSITVEDASSSIDL